MTEDDRARLHHAQDEARRLAAHVRALERRLQAAEVAARAATHARDVALRLAASMP
jgi:hypothetical protein